MRILRVVSMITKTILLINSDVTMQEVMQACLSHVAGWEVLSANSPSQGLQVAAQYQPDAILFDLSTFGMNFFTFSTKLRAQPETPDIPLVLLATGVKWLNIEPLKQLNVAGVIEYSSDPDQLHKQISDVLAWNEELQLPETENSSQLDCND